MCINKFQISAYLPSKNGQMVQIGRTYTISLLSNLEHQDMTHKTFNFESNNDQVEWSISTRMQYLYDKPALYRKILTQLEQRIKLLDNIIERIETQKRRKGILGKSFSKEFSSGIRNQTSCSFRAGYYSSNQSLPQHMNDSHYKSEVSND